MTKWLVVLLLAGQALGSSSVSEEQCYPCPNANRRNCEIDGKKGRPLREIALKHVCHNCLRNTRNNM